jgi:DNA-binding CsgD family transcriptional regulator
MTRDELARLLSSKHQPSLSSKLDVLDDRELELFSLIGQGYSGSRIEAMLGLDAQQLNAAKLSIRTKLKLKNELQLLRSAAQHSRTS